MLWRDGVSLAHSSDKVDVFPDSIIMFRLD